MQETQYNFKFRITEKQYKEVLSQNTASDEDAITIALAGLAIRECDSVSDIVLSSHLIYPSAVSLKKSNAETVIDWILERSWYRKFSLIIFYPGIGSQNTVAPKLLNDCRSCISYICFVSIPLNERTIGEVIDVESSQQYPLKSALITGSDLKYYQQVHDSNVDSTEITLRLDQAFGTQTRRLLSSLKIGVVGLSGTGSPLVELLYRLGVAELVFVDSDRIEEKNLSRMMNATVENAKQNRFKVELLKDAYSRIGLNTKISSIPSKVQTLEAIKDLAQCDVIFGCMDTHSGRAFLNRLCTFYLIPYFDVGVKLKADGVGGVSEVCGVVHYLEPDGSTLLDRRAITIEKIRAEDLQEQDPEQYEQLRKEKYIEGGNEESPAVISINTTIASMAVNDLLARLHPYRNQSNSEVESIAINLCELDFIKSPKTLPQQKKNYLGIGDITPPLDMPFLSGGS